MGGTYLFEGALDFGSPSRTTRPRGALPEEVAPHVEAREGWLHFSVTLATTHLHALEIAQSIARASKKAARGHYDVVDLEGDVRARGRPGSDLVVVAPDPPVDPVGAIIHPEPISCACGHGELVAVGGAARPRTKHSPPEEIGFGATVTLWNRKTRERILRIAESMQGAVALGFSPDGALLAIGRQESLEVWSIESGARLLRVKRGASSLLWSPDGGWLATSSWAGRHSQLLVYRAGSWSNPLRPPNVWRASRWLTDSEVLVVRKSGRGPQTTRAVLDVVSGSETSSVEWGRSRDRSVDGEHHIRAAERWDRATGTSTYTWDLVSTATGRTMESVPRENAVLVEPLRCSRSGFLVGRANTLVWLGPDVGPRDVATLGDDERVLALTHDDVLLCAPQGAAVLKEVPLSLP